jgi:hypothetical protein
MIRPDRQLRKPSGAGVMNAGTFSNSSPLHRHLKEELTMILQRHAIDRCGGCRVTIGTKHESKCPTAICWLTGERCSKCPHCQTADRYPFTGDLDPVFEGNNHHWVTRFGTVYDFWPEYRDRDLVGLMANRVGPGAWRSIAASPQANQITDLTFARPDLTLQTADDGVRALRKSTLLQQLRSLQIGETAREWDRPIGESDRPCEGGDVDSLLKLIAEAPRLRGLYLAVKYPDINRLLTARFPKRLKTLLISSEAHLDLGILARNRRLRLLKTLIVKQLGGDDAETGFHEQFAALVNSSWLKRVTTLHVEVAKTRGLDDTCCQALVRSWMIRRLRRLWLSGGGITDAGAAVLAASPALRDLEEVYLAGRGLTAKGIEALQRAGVRLSNAMPAISTDSPQVMPEEVAAPSVVVQERPSAETIATGQAHTFEASAVRLDEAMKELRAAAEALRRSPRPESATPVAGGADEGTAAEV